MRRQRLVFALGAVLVAALALAPPASSQGPVKLAIVAEVTGGGAPSGTMWRDGVILAVEEINKKSGGVLGRPLESFVMVEQNAAKALEISDYAYVLELGQNRYEGSGEAIRSDDRVRRLYLGR